MNPEHQIMQSILMNQPLEAAIRACMQNPSAAHVCKHIFLQHIPTEKWLDRHITYIDNLGDMTLSELTHKCSTDPNIRNICKSIFVDNVL